MMMVIVVMIVIVAVGVEAFKNISDDGGNSDDESGYGDVCGDRYR